MSLVAYTPPTTTLIKWISIAASTVPLISKCWEWFSSWNAPKSTPAPTIKSSSSSSSTGYSSPYSSSSSSSTGFSSRYYSPTPRTSPIPKGLFKTKFNVAIVGAVKAGKSSFINAFLKPKIPAEVDETEVVIIPTPYPSSQCEDFIFWDCPGAGTTSSPLETYHTTIGLEHYDLLVIICNSTFTQVESALVRAADKFKIPFILVRSQLDSQIYQLMKGPKKIPSADEAKQHYMDNYRIKVNKELEKIGKPPAGRVFFVSSQVYITPRTEWEPHYSMTDELRLFQDITHYYNLKTPRVVEVI